MPESLAGNFFFEALNSRNDRQTAFFKENKRSLPGHFMFYLIKYNQKRSPTIGKSGFSGHSDQAGEPLTAHGRRERVHRLRALICISTPLICISTHRLVNMPTALHCNALADSQQYLWAGKTSTRSRKSNALWQEGVQPGIRCACACRHLQPTCCTKQTCDCRRSLLVVGTW